MIHIYMLAFNEEIILDFSLNHYRKRFPSCKITIFDNESTDKTKEIALSHNCEVINWPSNRQIDDIQMRNLKNNCWKADQEFRWCLVADPDELLDITENQLKEEDIKGSTIIKAEGYNMINMENNFDLDSIVYGERFWAYDKAYLFNKYYIQDINYECGAHKCHPIGHVKYSEKSYLAYHYKFINMDYIVERYKMTAERLSVQNKANGMGAYNQMPEEQIRKDWMERLPHTVKIR